MGSRHQEEKSGSRLVEPPTDYITVEVLMRYVILTQTKRMNVSQTASREESNRVQPSQHMCT